MVDSNRNREELISTFTNKLFSAMLGEVVMDAALQSHRDIMRGKVVCTVCGTRCGSVHARGVQSNGAGHSSNGLSTSMPPGARNASPVSAGKAIEGTSMPTTKDKYDGNIYFECTNCQKKIASNRYAPHLSGCMGLGTGSRRGAARSATAKNKLGAEPDRTGSPLLGSNYGSPPQEALNGRGKGKVKNGKKINGKAVGSELNENHKRPGTPERSLSKKSKKRNTTVAEPPPLIPDGNNVKKPHIPMAAKMAQKNGTSVFAPGSPSNESQHSSRGSPSASISVSGSSFYALSPGANGGSKPPKTYKTLEALTKRRARPRGSGKNQIVASESMAAKRKFQERGEDPDFIDVDGEDHDESSSDSP